MTWHALADVVNKILNEPIKGDVHPILSLAKTDRERQLAKALKDPNYFEDETEATQVTMAERRRWIREAYKKPLAAAGVRSTAVTLGDNLRKSSASPAEVDCELAREKRLRRQATRGTIALFNSVRQHQSMLESHFKNSDLLETQKEHILTGMTTSDFLDRLSAGLLKSKYESNIASSPSLQTSITGVEGSSTDVQQPPVKRLRTTFGVKTKKVVTT